MSTNEMAPDPYRSPAYFADREEPAEVPARRPGGLTAICVISLVIGGLGLLLALFALIAMLVGNAMQNVGGPAPPIGVEGLEDVEGLEGEMVELQDEMAEAQQEMQGALQAVTDEYIVPNSVILVGRFVLALGLIVGAILVLMLRPNGRKLLLTVFLVSLLFEPTRFGVELYVQMQTIPVVEKYMARIMEITAAENPARAPDPQQMTSVLMTVTKIFGIGALVIFFLVKFIFFAIGARYLTKQKIKALFGLGEGKRSPYEPVPPTI